MGCQIYSTPEQYHVGFRTLEMDYHRRYILHLQSVFRFRFLSEMGVENLVCCILTLHGFSTPLIEILIKFCSVGF